MPLCIGSLYGGTSPMVGGVSFLWRPRSCQRPLNLFAGNRLLKPSHFDLGAMLRKACGIGW